MKPADPDDDLVRRSGTRLPAGTKVTPMLRQWLEAKAKAPDAILLFRMGDFYELFGDDAHAAGRVLELAVTTRDRDKGDNAMPMAGFPHPAAPQYIARLVAAGLKVAVCDQLEDPALAKGIVKRDVTRLVTPGMVIDEESLDPRANNFLVAVVPDEVHGGWGIGAVDVSTGETMGTVADTDSALLDEIARLQPREVVVPEGLSTAMTTALQAPRAGQATRRLEVRKTHGRARLVDALGSPDAMLLEPTRKIALAALELALGYVEEMGQGRLPRHLVAPRGYLLGSRLLLDATTRAHLDLCGPTSELRRRGTLIALLDETRSAAGGRRLLRMLLQPDAALASCARALDRVESFVVDAALRERLDDALRAMPDLERLLARVGNGRAGPRDLVRMHDALARVPVLVAALAEAAAWSDDVVAVHAHAQDCDALARHLQRALRDDAPAVLGDEPAIRPGFDGVLDELQASSSGGRDRIAALEEDEKRATGIPTLKVRWNSVFGYYIEVTKTHQAKVPAHYKRKQTIANGERYVIEALTALEVEVEGAEARRRAREGELFATLLAHVDAAAPSILACASLCAHVDAVLSLANVAAVRRWVRPQLLPADARRLEIVEGRHPIVEEITLARGEPFVPNSVTLDGDERQMLVVTGPNMGGKSTLMRQVALIQILAQAGSFVPAKSASLSLCDRIFTRVGASDDLAGGRSTFMVEMTETSHILRAATPHSLVLLDEIGRGTSTWDGVSIAWSVAEHLHDNTGARTLFATHYHELVHLQDTLPRLRNVHVVVKEWGDDIVFVRALADGPAEQSYGIQVARLAGLPSSVVTRAREILAALEGDRPVGVGEPNKGLPRARRPRARGPQMSLFGGASTTPAHDDEASLPQLDPHIVALLDRLRGLDINRMTPLQAMHMLANLVDDARRS